MGITPITNLAPLPIARTIQAAFDPLPMQRVENSARSGDETYSPSNGAGNGKSARGSENEASDDNMDDFADEPSDDSSGSFSEVPEPQAISFFA